MENNKQPQALKWALIIGIVIIANLFINYSISLVFDNPEYNDFCENKSVSSEVTEETCIEAGGEWNYYLDREFDSRPVMAPDQELKSSGWCDLYSECSATYDTAKEIFERNVFIILITFGIAMFALSLFLKSNYVVSVAFGLAAVLDFIVASLRYWPSAEKITQVIILAAALGILIYLAYKKFNE